MQYNILFESSRFDSAHHDHVGSLPPGGGGFNNILLDSFDGDSDTTSDIPCVGMCNNLFFLFLKVVVIKYHYTTSW